MVIATKKYEKFFELNRDNFIFTLFNNSIKLEMYDISYELCHYFLDDLVKVKYFTVIDTFFT